MPMDKVRTTYRVLSGFSADGSRHFDQRGFPIMAVAYIDAPIKVKVEDRVRWRDVLRAVV
jgi:hypothetical protein